MTWLLVGILALIGVAVVVVLWLTRDRAPDSAFLAALTVEMRALRDMQDRLGQQMTDA